MKILFVYDHQYPELWKDGLWAALNILEKQGFKIAKYNLAENKPPKIPRGPPFPDSDWNIDFTLGWGAFGSPVDKWLQDHPFKKGLCIAGNSFPPVGQDNYDVLFYETEWYLSQIQHHKNVVRAFGINSDIYKPIPDAIKIWDWISVGAFALWKRQHLLKNKGGYKLAVGEIQKNNISESIDIIGDLLLDGIAVSDMVDPEKLVSIYNSASNVLISADINGGGERAVLEARACGIPVTIESDNPKLKELLFWTERGHVPDQFWYADQLKRGIESCF